MRYLLLNSLKAGGAERVAQILASTGIFDEIILLEDEIDYKVSIPTKKLSYHTSQTSSVYKTLFLPIYARRLNRMIKGKDVVVSFTERANFVNIISSWSTGHLPIISVHTNIKSEFKRPTKYLYYLLIKWLYPKAAAIVSVSKGIKGVIDEAIGKWKNINTVIYNPVILSDFRPASLEDRKIIVNVGRLSSPKGQWNLLRIFKKVLEKEPDAKLYIAGDGEMRDFLINCSQELGLKTFWGKPEEAQFKTNEVFFLGYQENVSRLYHLASILVMTSILEGLPMAILEAMACGLPVISSDCPYGPSEILKKDGRSFGVLMPSAGGEKNNFAKEQENDQIWADKILELLSNKEMSATLSKKALERASDFSLEKTKDEWISLFSQLEQGR